MSDFLKKLNNTLGEEFNVSETENGAIGYATTGLPLLDLNYSISSLRLMDEERILKKFKKALGDSPITYLNKLKIYRAMYFLAERNFTLSEISRKIGIYDSSYFSKLFKSYTGITPMEYRSIFINK